VTGVTIDLLYVTVDAVASSLVPEEGPMEGGTVLFITGYGFPQSKLFVCEIGGIIVPAYFENKTLINCTTPPGAKPVNVSVRISADRKTWVDAGSFEYIAQDSEIKLYEWIILGAGVFILLMCGVAIFLLKRWKTRSKKKWMEPADASSYLLGVDSDRFNDFKPVEPKEISLGERIGRGSYGEVFKGIWRGTVIAVKKAKLERDEEKYEETLKDLLKEIYIMKSLRHPNVLQFLGYCNVESEIMLITEYMPKGSLYKILHDKNIKLEWNMLINIALDIARGMNYLHCSDPIVIHRDLKSHNLLVSEHWVVKVCDFGLSRLFLPTGQAMTSCGTPCWTAPEVLRNEQYTEKADVYSFGIVLWELHTREDPFAGMPPFQVIFAVAQSGMRPEIPSHCPKKFGMLIDECWTSIPEDRPSFYDIMTRLEDMYL